MLSLKESLFLHSSGDQENLLFLGDWQIGWRKCKIFLLNCILLLIMSCERQMLWRMVLLGKEFFNYTFLLMFNLVV